jgi:hypothetical protein
MIFVKIVTFLKNQTIPHYLSIYSSIIINVNNKGKCFLLYSSVNCGNNSL